MLTITALDPSLGRFNRASLSDQLLMELLIEHLKRPCTRKFREPAGSFLDVCLWEGVICDSDANVTQIIFTDDIDNILEELEGSLQLQFLPPKLTDFMFNASLEGIEGEFDASELPGELVGFDIENNRIQGELIVQHLPQSLELFIIANNKITGECDFTALPPRTKIWSIAQNSLHGSADLTRLPESLERLRFHSNGFSGEVSFEKLPPNLKTVYASMNKFCGNFSLSSPPEKLELLTIERNKFAGTAVVNRSAWHKVFLGSNELTAAVDENGASYTEDEIFINFSMKIEK